MSQKAPTDTASKTPSKWANWHARNEWLSWDLGAGLTATALVLGCALADHRILSGGPDALYAVLGASLAIAGLVLAGLAVLVALISEDYLALLRTNPRGLAGAWRPYVLVAWVALLAAALSILTATLWAGLSGDGRAIGLALPVGLLVWAVVGTGQLVVITKFHGEMRAELLAHRLSARTLLSQRKVERDKSA